MNDILKKIKKLIRENSFGVYLFVFMIPFQPKWYGLAIMLMVLEQFIKRPKIKRAYLLQNISLKNAGVWLSLFYLMHIFGIHNTQNLDFAWMDIGMKASFLILPLFFLIVPIQFKWRSFMNAYLIGICVSVIYNLSFAFVNYIEYKEFNSFYGPDLSQLMHRGYWASYLSIAYFFCWYIFLYEKGNTFKYTIGIAMAFLLTLLTGAKIGVILLLSISIVMMVIWMRRSRKKLLILFVGSGLVLSVFVVHWSLPQIYERIELSVKTVLIPMEKRDKNSYESTTTRIFMWDTALDLISENFWLGVGTGDVKDELQKRNYSKGFNGVADKKFNSHNQFLNTHVAIGFFGLLFLLLAFITPVIFSKGNYKKMVVGVVLILFLSLIPEAFLETQAGIVPVAFLLSLFGVEARASHAESKVS